MARLPNSLSRTSQLALLLVVLLTASAGVASAAVAGDFTSSYDGYNDDSDTSVPGHEIQVSGSLEFSGENAVDARIVVYSSQHTVLEDSSVELLQPGASSVDFTRDYVNRGVRYSADEVPSGTRLELEFVVYPVSGLTQSELTSAEVVVRYDTPAGDQEESRMEVTTAMSNTPAQVINSQGNDQQVHIAVWVFAGIGALAVALVVLMALYSVIGGGGGGPPKS
ncbi:hypothetical protein [Haloplanus aerogenes]|uniref:Uncharacterized protein n=1 Tax=Haloplanus aerogenes TaxID=660522 RepID=A0A3M0DP81_9EURY|nr:hypothetical protein [Haloplanus aerogenes]AZH24655.1 hypothetical protein DU502_04315 [Haloplanus aerogenes]RMB23688.1 hypothetical protein ATH50_0913 [Haloplanus aerogenes]